MNSRSKKYVESRKAAKDGKKGTATVKDSKDQNKKTMKQPTENSGTTAKPVQPEVQTSSATQDDTGGGNDSGKRIDEN